MQHIQSKLFWWWGFFMYKQRGKPWLSNMLGILQPCGECSLCLVVWPHNVQELYPWSSLGCCQVPSLPIQLPLFISCPWCNLLSFRLVYKGNLRFPRKNYFLLWMVESMNGERAKFHSTNHNEHHSSWHSSAGPSSSHHHQRNAVIRAESSSAGDTNFIHNIFHTDNIGASLQKLMVCFMQLTAKFPLVIIFLLIVLYAVPASAAVLVLYVLVTFLFALPSFFILYFAYPSLDWLVREIFA